MSNVTSIRSFMPSNSTVAVKTYECDILSKWFYDRSCQDANRLLFDADDRILLAVDVDSDETYMFQGKQRVKRETFIEKSVLPTLEDKKMFKDVLKAIHDDTVTKDLKLIGATHDDLTMAAPVISFVAAMVAFHHVKAKLAIPDYVLSLAHLASPSSLYSYRYTKYDPQNARFHASEDGLITELIDIPTGVRVNGCSLMTRALGGDTGIYRRTAGTKAFNPDAPIAVSVKVDDFRLSTGVSRNERSFILRSRLSDKKMAASAQPRVQSMVERLREGEAAPQPRETHFTPIPSTNVLLPHPTAQPAPSNYSVQDQMAASGTANNALSGNVDLSGLQVTTSTSTGMPQAAGHNAMAFTSYRNNLQMPPRPSYPSQFTSGLGQQMSYN